jgi:magnesium-protoporphyrin O-methyltransferase
MTSCGCERIESKFDEAYAAEKLELYRRAGPDASTRALLEALLAEDIDGKTLLDIGGGVGAVQHALLKAGVVSVQEVEASAAHVAACREEAEHQGHADLIEHLMGDLGSVAGEVEPADIVTLDRSVCCWPDMPDLSERSAVKARRFLGIVYPRDVWWVRHGWRAYSNVRQVLRRNPMRVYTHRTGDVEAILARHGLERHSYTEVGVWQVVVYAKNRP